MLHLNTIYRFVSKSTLIEAKFYPKSTFNFMLDVTLWRDLRESSQNLSCVVTLSIYYIMCVTGIPWTDKRLWKKLWLLPQVKLSYILSIYITDICGISAVVFVCRQINISKGYLVGHIRVQ